MESLHLEALTSPWREPQTQVWDPLVLRPWLKSGGHIYTATPHLCARPRPLHSTNAPFPLSLGSSFLVTSVPMPRFSHSKCAPFFFPPPISDMALLCSSHFCVWAGPMHALCCCHYQRRDGGRFLSHSTMEAPFRKVPTGPVWGIARSRPTRSCSSHGLRSMAAPCPGPPCARTLRVRLEIHALLYVAAFLTSSRGALPEGAPGGG